MANYQINTYVDTPFGQLHIYSDPQQSARAAKLLKDNPKILTLAWKDAAERMGKEIVKVARRCIDSGMPPKGASWPPLSPKYVEAMGGDDRIYYKTGQYYENIGVWPDKVFYAGSGAYAYTRYFIGLKPGVEKWAARYRSNRKPLTLIQVANILEFGSTRRHIPPRPLWRPIWQNSGGKERVKVFVRNAIKRQLIKYMI